MSGWISVEDRLPENDLFLAAVKLRVGYFYAVAEYGELGQLVDQDGTDLGYSNEDLTFWMPLPDPPEEVE